MSEALVEQVYTPELAQIHHAHFGDVGEAAARALATQLGSRRGRVVELGVGSGVSTRVLLDAGFEVVGVDACVAMLGLAKGHAPGAVFEQGSLWRCDIPPALAVTAFGEVLNYVAGDEVPDLDRLGRRFKTIKDALEPGGLFMFDVTTGSALAPDEEDVRGVRFEAEDVFLVMEETQRDGALERIIDSFVPAAEGEALYRRIHEVHRLILFDPDDVGRLLREAGFEDVACLDAYDDMPLQEGWCAFVARA